MFKKIIKVVFAVLIVITVGLVGVSFRLCQNTVSCW